MLNNNDECYFEKKYKIIKNIGQGAHSMVYKLERQDNTFFAAKKTICPDEEIQNMVNKFI